MALFYSLPNLAGVWIHRNRSLEHAAVDFTGYWYWFLLASILELCLKRKLELSRKVASGENCSINILTVDVLPISIPSSHGIKFERFPTFGNSITIHKFIASTPTGGSGSFKWLHDFDIYIKSRDLIKHCFRHRKLYFSIVTDDFNGNIKPW